MGAANGFARALADIRAGGATSATFPKAMAFSGMSTEIDITSC